MCQEHKEIFLGVISEAMQGKRAHNLIVGSRVLHHPFPEIVSSSITHFIYCIYHLMQFGCLKKSFLKKQISLKGQRLNNIEEAHK